MPFEQFEKILKSIKTSLDKQIQKTDRPNQWIPVRFTFNLGEIKSFYIMLQLLWLVYMES